MTQPNSEANIRRRSRRATSVRRLRHRRWPRRRRLRSRAGSEYADPDAGQRVEQGSDSHTIPDLEADGFSGAVVVYVKQRPATAAAAHKAVIDEECETSDALVVTILGQSIGPSQTVTDVVRSVVIHR